MDKNFISGQVLKASELNDIVDEITGLQESIPSLDPEEIEREQIRIQGLILNAEDKLLNLSNEISNFNIDTINSAIQLLNDARVDADRRLADAEKKLAEHGVKFEELSDEFDKDMTEAYKLIEDAKKALEEATAKLAALLGDEGDAGIDIMDTLGAIRTFAEWYSVNEGTIIQYQDVIDAMNGLKEEWASYTDTVNGTLNEYDLRIDIKNGEIETALSSVNTAVGIVSGYDSRLSVAEGTLARVMTWEDTINGIDTKIATEISAAEGTITTSLQNYTDGLFKEYESAYDAKYATKSEVNSYVDSLVESSIKTWTDAKDTEIAALAERIDTTEQTVTDYEARISLVEGTKDEVLSIANTANQTVNTVKTQMDVLSASYTVTASKVDLNSSDISQLKVSADKINAVVVGEGTDESPYKIAAIEIDEDAITSTVISTIGGTIEGYANEAKVSAASAANSASSASNSASAAANSASSANGYASSASSSAASANTSAEQAGLYAGQAESFKNTSESILNTVTSLKTAAETAKADAELAKRNALSSANDAFTYKKNAESYMNSANAAKDSALESEKAAKQAKDAALSAEANAKESELNAKTYADNANVNYDTVFSTLNQQKDTISMIVSAGESTRDEDGNITSYKPIKEAAILEYISTENANGKHLLNSNIVMSADNIILLGNAIAKTINTEDLVINGGVSGFNKDGSGYVANGAISWTENGIVDGVSTQSLSINNVSTMNIEIPKFVKKENTFSFIMYGETHSLSDTENIAGTFTYNKRDYIVIYNTVASLTAIKTVYILKHDDRFEYSLSNLKYINTSLKRAYILQMNNDVFLIGVTDQSSSYGENRLVIYKFDNGLPANNIVTIDNYSTAYKVGTLSTMSERLYNIVDNTSLMLFRGENKGTYYILLYTGGKWMFVTRTISDVDGSFGDPGIIYKGSASEMVVPVVTTSGKLRMYNLGIFANYSTYVGEEDVEYDPNKKPMFISGEASHSNTDGSLKNVKTPAILMYDNKFWIIGNNGTRFFIYEEITDSVTNYQLSKDLLLSVTENIVNTPRWIEYNNFLILTTKPYIYSKNHTKVHKTDIDGYGTIDVSDFKRGYYMLYNNKNVFYYEPYSKNIIDLIYDTLLP